MENPFKTKEQLNIKIKVASPEDWQKYKELKLETIYGKDNYMFGVTPNNMWGRAIKEEAKFEKEWKEIVDHKDAFGVLSLNGDTPVGIGLAEKREKEGDWLMYSGYVKEDFRGKGIGKKMFATRLNEIRLNREGTKIIMVVKANNDKSIKLAESFGFKRQEEGSNDEGFYMVLENVNSPEVIKRINEVLNAG